MKRQRCGVVAKALLSNTHPILFKPYEEDGYLRDGRSRRRIESEGLKIRRHCGSALSVFKLQ